MMTDNQIIEGDCLTILKQLPDASVDLVITDPPYLGRYKDRLGRTLANDDAVVVVAAAPISLYSGLVVEWLC